MYTVTWITAANKIETISSPRYSAAARVFIVMRKAGFAARLWHNGKQLIF